MSERSSQSAPVRSKPNNELDLPAAEVTLILAQQCERILIELVDGSDQRQLMRDLYPPERVAEELKLFSKAWRSLTNGDLDRIATYHACAHLQDPLILNPA